MIESSRRVLPILAAGEHALEQRVLGMGEALVEETRWEAHSHAHHELLWNKNGMSMATIASQTWAISPSIGLWIPAGIVHTGYAPKGTWYRAAHFDVTDFAPLAEEPFAVEMTPLLLLLIERLEEGELTEVQRLRTAEMVHDVLSPAPGALVVRRPLGALIAPMAEAIIADPGDQRTLSQWAQILGVSERTLTRTFVAETGMNFSQWIGAVRSQRAMLLLGSGLSVEEVAAHVGYSSVSAFGSAFRRTTGMTPGRARPADPPSPER